MQKVQTTAPPTTNQNSIPAIIRSAAAATTATIIPQAKQPAVAGKLHEIDLGPAARRRNEKATLRANRLLDAGSSARASEDDDEDSDDEEDDQPMNSGKKKKRMKKLLPKVRVNRFGRVLQPKRRRRVAERSMSDIQRDRVVEEILRMEGENPASAAETVEGKRGVEADEEMAERFKREFIENSFGGGRGRVSAKVVGKKDERKSSGPRMGGSRSMRQQAMKNRVKPG